MWRRKNVSSHPFEPFFKTSCYRLQFESTMHHFDGPRLYHATPFLNLCIYFTEFTSSQEAINFSGPINVAFNGNTCWNVFEEDAVVCFIDFLPSSATTTNKFFFKILLANAKFCHSLLNSFNFFWPNH